MSSNLSETSPSDSSRSSGLTSSLKRERRRGCRTVPKDAVLIPNIPEADYFSDVTGVYYHFKKMEWRTICKDPFKNSKRWQKTFGINKYGFYEARRLAEMKAHEVSEANKLSKLLRRYGSFRDDPSLPPRFFAPLPGSGPRFNFSSKTSTFDFGSGDTPPSDTMNDLYAGSSRLNGPNSRGAYLPAFSPHTHKLAGLYYRNSLVAVPKSKVNGNIFTYTPTFPYRLVSLATPNRLKGSDFT